MTSPNGLAKACGLLDTHSERGSWYRAVGPRFLESALEVRHPLRAGRFGVAGGPPVLYLTGNPEVAIYEVELVLGRPGEPGRSAPNDRAGACILLTLRVQLSAVADLTAGQAQESLQTTAQELTGDWRGYSQRNPLTRLGSPIGVAPTQALGATLHASGRFEGFISYSAKVPYEPVLCVFPDRLQSGSFLEYRWEDARGAGQVRRIEPPV